MNNKISSSGLEKVNLLKLVAAPILFIDATTFPSNMLCFNGIDNTHVLTEYITIYFCKINSKTQITKPFKKYFDLFDILLC